MRFHETRVLSGAALPEALNGGSIALPKPPILSGLGDFVRGAQPGMERALNPARPGRGVLAGEMDPAFGLGGGCKRREIAGPCDRERAPGIRFVQPRPGCRGP